MVQWRHPAECECALQQVELNLVGGKICKRLYITPAKKDTWTPELDELPRDRCTRRAPRRSSRLHPTGCMHVHDRESRARKAHKRTVMLRFSYLPPTVARLSTL